MGRPWGGAGPPSATPARLLPCRLQRVSCLLRAWHLLASWSAPWSPVGSSAGVAGSGHQAALHVPWRDQETLGSFGEQHPRGLQGRSVMPSGPRECVGGGRGGALTAGGLAQPGGGARPCRESRLEPRKMGVYKPLKCPQGLEAVGFRVGLPSWASGRLGFLVSLPFLPRRSRVRFGHGPV